MGSLSANSLTACIQGCDSTPGCVNISLSGSACYLKQSLGAAHSQSGTYGARKIANPSATAASMTTTTSSVSTASPWPTGPSCPASNNTLVTASSGAQFMVECGIVRTISCIRSKFLLTAGIGSRSRRHGPSKCLSRLRLAMSPNLRLHTRLCGRLGARYRMLPQILCRGGLVQCTD